MSLRRSTPRKDKEETKFIAPPHDQKYPMHYCISYKTGESVPGHFYNPPPYCVERIFNYNNERWVDAGTCLACPERKRGCVAKQCDHRKTWDELMEEVRNRRPRRRS